MISDYDNFIFNGFASNVWQQLSSFIVCDNFIYRNDFDFPDFCLFVKYDTPLNHQGEPSQTDEKWTATLQAQRKGRLVIMNADEYFVQHPDCIPFGTYVRCSDFEGFKTARKWSWELALYMADTNGNGALSLTEGNVLWESLNITVPWRVFIEMEIPFLLDLTYIEASTYPDIVVSESNQAEIANHVLQCGANFLVTNWPEKIYTEQPYYFNFLSEDQEWAISPRFNESLWDSECLDENVKVYEYAMNSRMPFVTHCDVFGMVLQSHHSLNCNDSIEAFGFTGTLRDTCCDFCTRVDQGLMYEFEGCEKHDDCDSTDYFCASCSSCEFYDVDCPLCSSGAESVCIPIANCGLRGQGAFVSVDSTCPEYFVSDSVACSKAAILTEESVLGNEQCNTAFTAYYLSELDVYTASICECYRSSDFSSSSCALDHNHYSLQQSWNWCRSAKCEDILDQYICQSRTECSWNPGVILGYCVLEGTYTPTRFPSVNPTSMPSTQPSRHPVQSVRPSTSPVISFPSVSPSLNPTATTTTSTPSFSPTSELPSISPVTSPPSNLPSALPSFSSPSLTPTTPPTSTDPSVFPTSSPTGMPTASDPTTSPTNLPLTSNPTTQPLTSCPSITPSSLPTTPRPTAPPICDPQDLSKTLSAKSSECSTFAWRTLNRLFVTEEDTCQCLRTWSQSEASHFQCLATSNSPKFLVQQWEDCNVLETTTVSPFIVPPADETCTQIQLYELLSHPLWGGKCIGYTGVVLGIPVAMQESEKCICVESFTPDFLASMNCRPVLSEITFPQQADRCSRTPSISPAISPSYNPLPSDFNKPTSGPSAGPTVIPTNDPTVSPSSLDPTSSPTSKIPTSSPSIPKPTRNPVLSPTQEPTDNPSSTPSCYPTQDPSFNPTDKPSSKPSTSPTDSPTTMSPTRNPSKGPTISPTNHPTTGPSSIPTSDPTMFTDEPTVMPTLFPSMEPSLLPSLAPTKEPSRRPTFNPSLTPTSTPTFNPSFEPTEEPSIAPSADPTQSGSADPTESTDGWCVNDISSDTPRRFPGSTLDCVSDLNGGTRDWLVSGVSSRMEERGLMNEDEELCIIQHGVDDYEWAVVYDGFIYPTCVQSGSVVKPTTSMVPNSEDGSSTNLNKQANQLQFEGVFDRRNYMAYSCPPVQSYCSVDSINSWWIGEVESVISSLGVAVEDDWSSNICIGEDGAVRVITQTEILNTCSGYVYESGMTDEDVRNSYCEGYNTWECGTKIFSPFENPGPGYPVNQFRQIARAITQDDYTLPECSFNNNNYCQVESMEQREQPRYSDLSNCVDASHPQYDPSLPSVLDRIRAKDTTGSTYDLCYMADEDDDLQYVLFVDGVGYPTCVSAPTSSEEDCPTDKFWCVEAERSNWPNTVANRLKEGKVYGADGEVPRANHMHWLCPTIQDICLPGGPLASTNGGLKNFELGELEPPEMAGQFDNNLCVGANGGIRVVTADGIQPTCTSYIYNTELMGNGNEQREVCPSERNFMCGSLQEVTGEKTVGWMTAQHEVVRTALRQSDYLHPHCPYLECREC